MMVTVCECVENLVGKGDNVGGQHLAPFPTEFEFPKVR